MMKISILFSIIILKSKFQWILSEGLQLQLKPFSEPHESSSPNIYNLTEHESLEIRCTYENKLPILIYPDLIDTPRWSKRTRSPTVITNYTETYYDSYGTQVKNHTLVLRKNKTLFGDTGEYGCRNNVGKKSDPTEIHIITNVSFFAEENVIPKPIFSLSGDGYMNFKPYFKLLCQTTSPEHSVFVQWENFERTNSTRIELGAYDQRTYIEPGEYTCGPSKNEQFLATKKFVIVSEPCRKSPIKITGKRLVHVIRNQTLRINCTMEDDLFRPADLSWWSSEGNLSRITTRYEIPHPTLMNCRTVVNELKILNVNDDDMGKLYCTNSSRDSMQRSTRVVVSTELEVHDVNFTTCKLSTTVNHHKSIVGDSIQFNVSIDSYPHLPQITWFDLSKKTIKGERIEDQKDKFIVETSDAESKLTIMNLSFSDDGSYRVRAKTPDHQDSIIFTLDIWEHHLMRDIINVQNFYMQDDFANISCITAPDLDLEIMWTFTVDRSSLPPSSEERIAEMEFTSSNSTVGWRIQSSGTITCKVCISNSTEPDKCHTAKRQILMTDIPDGFGIIPSKEIVMIGDSLELICAASIYHYTDQIQWLNVDGSPLVISDKLGIKITKTPLSYRTILTMNITEEENRRIYSCSSFRKNGGTDTENYTVNVNYPMDASIVSTNMNNTKSVYDIRIMNIKKVILTCYVDGMPRPVISWWKDDQELNRLNQTDSGVCELRFFNENQEMHIDHLYEKCSGIYRCLITNEFKKQEAFQKIIIIESSHNKEKEVVFDIVMFSTIILVALLILLMIIGIYCWIDKRKMEQKLLYAGSTSLNQKGRDSSKPEITIVEQNPTFTRIHHNTQKRRSANSQTER